MLSVFQVVFGGSRGLNWLVGLGKAAGPGLVGCWEQPFCSHTPAEPASRQLLKCSSQFLLLKESGGESVFDADQWEQEFQGQKSKHIGTHSKGFYKVFSVT